MAYLPKSQENLSNLLVTACFISSSLIDGNINAFMSYVPFKFHLMFIIYKINILLKVFLTSFPLQYCKTVTKLEKKTWLLEC